MIQNQGSCHREKAQNQAEPYDLFEQGQVEKIERNVARKNRVDHAEIHGMEPAPHDLPSLRRPRGKKNSGHKRRQAQGFAHQLFRKSVGGDLSGRRRNADLNPARCAVGVPQVQVKKEKRE